MGQDAEKARAAAMAATGGRELEPRAVMAQIEAFEALSRLVEVQRRAWAAHLHKPAAEFVEKAEAFSKLGRMALATMEE